MSSPHYGLGLGGDMVKFVELPEVDKNLVVVAPTGSGKTTAVLRRLEDWIGNFKKVFLTFPTKRLMSEVSQKLTEMGIKHLVDNSDARLEKNINLNDWFSNSVIIASYEKLDSVLMLEPGLTVGSLIVIDEVHLASAGKNAEEERSVSILSLMATAKEMDARVIVMSATIPNVNELANYLEAEIVSVENSINREIRFVEIPSIPWGKKRYMNVIIARLLEELQDGKKTIVFRISRRDCEEIAEVLKKNGIKAEVIHAGIEHDRQEETMKKFIDGEIQVIVATHSLTWGVNTPAEKIVIAGLITYTPTGAVINRFIKTTDIAQMAGRAGRPGWTETAEVVAIVTTENIYYEPEGTYMTEKEFVMKGLSGDYSEEIGLKGELETVILRLAKVGKIKTREDIQKISTTWFNVPPVRAFDLAMENLVEYELITVNNKRVSLTKEGHVVAENYIEFKMFKWIKEILGDEPESREELLTAVAKVAKKLRNTTMRIPEKALMDSVVINTVDEEAREVLAQFAEVTGDTNSLAETMKKIAFTTARLGIVWRWHPETVESLFILGKTMKRIRSMIWNKVRIEGVLKMYVEKKIDQLFEVKM